MPHITTEYTGQYKKDFKLMCKRGKNPQKLLDIVNLLLENANKGMEYHLLLPQKHRLHKLSGQYEDCWECHIERDWLLIYSIDDKTIMLQHTCTHSDFMDKIRR